MGKIYKSTKNKNGIKQDNAHRHKENSLCVCKVNTLCEFVDVLFHVVVVEIMMDSLIRARLTGKLSH